MSLQEIPNGKIAVFGFLMYRRSERYSTEVMVTNHHVVLTFRSRLFFGEPDRRHVSNLVEIVIWTFDIACIAGIEFFFTGASQNGHLGHIGPFGDAYPLPRNFDNSQDHRILMSIDGPGGEDLRNFEVQEKGDT